MEPFGNLAIGRRHLGDLGQAITAASALLPLAFRSRISSFMAAFSSALKTFEAMLREGFFVVAIGLLLQ